MHFLELSMIMSVEHSRCTDIGAPAIIIMATPTEPAAPSRTHRPLTANLSLSKEGKVLVVSAQGTIGKRHWEESGRE